MKDQRYRYIKFYAKELANGQGASVQMQEIYLGVE